MSEAGQITEGMDKKSTGRMPSASPRGNVAECKRENGNIVNKSGRVGYKRENTGPRPRNEQNNRKPYSQKPRPVEKRSRPRESYNYRQGEEVTEEYRTDNSVLKLGNKKKNLNHLLNFSVSSRDGNAYSEHRSVYIAPSPRYKRGVYGKKTVMKYNKEQFLQANCQFVVKEGDYMVHSVDPDILVDWDHIEQIRIYSNEVPSCPICLYPPVAAKITRCGHIYCWRCMLHYLSLSERKTWRKCPICYEAVHQKDLKSVKALEMRSYESGGEITMLLMKREKHSTYAMPVQQWQAERNSKPHNVTDNVDLAFSKLLVASPDEVQTNIIDVEMTALQTQLAEEGESLEGSYVKAAMELLKERQVSVYMAKAARDALYEKVEVLGQQDSTKPNVDSVDQASDNSFAPLGREVIEYSSAFSDEEAPRSAEGDKFPVSTQLASSHSTSNLQGIGIRTASESGDENRTPAATFPGTPSTDELQLPTNTLCMIGTDGESVPVSVDEAAQELVLPSSRGDGCNSTNKEVASRSNAFYFYQSSDGQQVYLHSLNARCLVKEYGSLENCPTSITARIVEMEGISMNEELRGRLRYLNHVPLTCEFRVVELVLKPPTISRETIQHFAEDIEKRKRQRLKKNRDERRQLKKMQQQQHRKYEHDPEMRVLLDGHHFPESSSTIVRSEMPSLLESEHGVPSTISTPDNVTPVGSPPNVADLSGSQASEDDGQTSMSFAQMLRAGKMKAKAAPEWRQSVAGSARAGSDEGSDSEERAIAPTYRQSFGDAIRTALENYNKHPGTDVSVSTAVQAVQSGGAGKNKKKKTKTLLFTTNMARNK